MNDQAAVILLFSIGLGVIVASLAVTMIYRFKDAVEAHEETEKWSRFDKENRDRLRETGRNWANQDYSKLTKGQPIGILPQGTPIEIRRAYLSQMSSLTKRHGEPVPHPSTETVSISSEIVKPSESWSE